jgi:outer membrane lipopolysaccharide assembly protein LptE/RlpB
VEIVSFRLPAIAAVLALVLSSTGCGYRVASGNRVPLPFQTVAVRPLENLTTTYEVEQILTRALVGEMVKQTGNTVVGDENRADAILSGRITRISVNPVTFARSAFASTFLVTVYAQIRLEERSSGRTLFENNRYVFREQYIINADVENFFSEMNPALQRISEDFASAVVAAIVEMF